MCVQFDMPSRPGTRKLLFSSAGTPPALENFWRIYHFQDGDETRILGSDSAPSWPIRPQIEGLQIALAGVKVPEAYRAQRRVLELRRVVWCAERHTVNTLQHHETLSLLKCSTGCETP